MNTIETYVAWNFHEAAPGVFDWEGDRNLDAFIAECERQDMYVIVRPGPYICAEWDYGGFPAWLQTVPGIAFRTMNQPYLDAIDRYFDAVAPIIARHQWTRGGGVILVQVENEYANLKWTRGPDMVVDDAYQHYVRDGLLRRGIDVPLLSCAGYCSGTVEGVNSHNPGDLMPEFRATFPDKPLFSTEFWTAWYDAWELPHHTRSPEDVEYASWRCWAEGACGYNYYVYHGGTNFGYTPMYIQTTSYDYDAQISETGRLTDKWRASRRVALFARTFKDILLNGAHNRELQSVRGGLRGSATTTPQNGSIVWIDNPSETETVTGSLLPSLPEITLAPRTLFPFVHDVPIGAGASYLKSYAGLVKSEAYVLAAHILPDPFDGVRVYVYGVPGETREVALWSGNEKGAGVRVTIPADAPAVYRIGQSQIIALSMALAGRTWIHPTDENAPVLIGPDDVCEHDFEYATIEAKPGVPQTLFALRADGAVTEISFDPPALPHPPTLGAWQSASEPDYTSVNFDDASWLPIDEVATGGNMIALGAGSNPYGWYRSTIHLPEGDGGDAQIHFAACSDRLTLWINGERIGSSAIPPEDRREDWTAAFDIRFRDGENTVCVLADGLGLVKGDWNIGKGLEHEKKGIYGPVTITPSGGCYLIDVARWQFQPLLHGEREGWWKPGSWPSAVAPGSVEMGSPIRWFRTTFTLDAPLETATPLLVRMNGMGKGVLWLNGHNLGRYWQSAGPQRDYYAPEPWLNVGENELVVVETEGNAPDNVCLVWDANASAQVRVAL
jgi:hypothetical protein